MRERRAYFFGGASKGSSEPRRVMGIAAFWPPRAGAAASLARPSTKRIYRPADDGDGGDDDDDDDDDDDGDKNVFFSVLFVCIYCIYK